MSSKKIRTHIINDHLYRFLSISFILSFFFLVSNTLSGQCLPSVTFPGCTPAGSIPLTSGATINAGTTMTVNGTVSYASVTLNGGTLIVCGSLTVSAMTVNSGTIYVNAGSTLNCNGGGVVTLNAGTNYYNNGTSTFSGHLVLNANVNFINNGILSSPFNYIIIQGLNSYIVNNNQISSAGFMAWIPSSPGCLCLGDNSITTTNYFYNRTTNSVVVPVGYACLNVTQFASNDNLVSPDAELIVCLPASISYGGLPNWGSASISANCPGCLTALPIELISFDGYIENKKAFLHWETLSETNNCFFRIERSTDGIAYNVVNSVDGAMSSTALIAYQIVDPDLEPDVIYYYRLKQEDCDGNISYSHIVALSDKGNDVEFIVSNITSEKIGIINGGLIEELTIYDGLGQIVYDHYAINEIDLSAFKSGMYFLHITTKTGQTKAYKIMKI